MEGRCGSQMAQPSIRATLDALHSTYNLPIRVTCALLDALAAHIVAGAFACNANRNSQQRKILNSKSAPSHASKRCTPARGMHVVHTSTKHSPAAGVLFAPLVPLVRVAPAVSPCLCLGLAALCLSFSYVLCMGVSWHRGSSGYSRARASTKRLEQACSALCGSSMPAASRQRPSPLAAVAASAFVEVGACCPHPSLALRASFSVFPLPFPPPSNVFYWCPSSFSSFPGQNSPLGISPRQRGHHRSCQAPRQRRRGRRQPLEAEVHDNSFEF